MGTLACGSARTFALASLTGVLRTITGGESLLTVIISGVFVLTAFSYLRGHEDDPARITWIVRVKSILAPVAEPKKR